MAAGSAATSTLNQRIQVSFLILYGVLFIVVENYNKNRRPRTRKLETLPWSTALLIGVFQILALIPGTSRSGSTQLQQNAVLAKVAV